MSPAIRFDDVHRHFGDQRVLRGLSFAVEPGEIFAFLGRNGAGKTTALRILLGFLQPHRGRAAVLGRDSAELRPEDRLRIGYVGEGHRFDPTMRVRDAVAFEQGTRPGFRRALVDDALSRCGLRPGRMVAALSRGQRAQLALILAVATDPEVLVFDDPAMGLDVVMRREFLDAMIDLLADRGVAVLFSSHILTDVERVADRIGILHDGALLVDAPLAELKQRVTRWVWTGDGDAEPPRGPGVLRRARRRGAWELTLLDADRDDPEDQDRPMAATLRGTGRLEGPATPNLEELFLDLTGPEQPGLLAPPGAGSPHAGGGLR